MLLQPYLTKILIDDGLLGKSFTTLLTAASAILLVGFASTGLAGVNRYLHTQLSGSILFKLRESVYSHLQTLAPNFYAQQRTGDLLSRMDGDIAELQRFAVDGLFASISGLLGLIGAVFAELEIGLAAADSDSATVALFAPHAATGRAANPQNARTLGRHFLLSCGNATQHETDSILGCRGA